MSTYLGIDIGAVSIQAALGVEAAPADRFASGNGEGLPLRRLAASADGRRDGQPRYEVLVSPYRRTRGRPLEILGGLIEELTRCVPVEEIAGLMLTGSGSERLAKAMKAGRCNEFAALARAVDLLYPAARTVFEMGGESSKYLRLVPDPGSGRLGIVDYSANGDCAAGTGAFLDQQAGRLKFAVEDIGRIVAEAERCAQIAGRCSVFA